MHTFKVGDLVEILDVGFIRPSLRRYIGLTAEVMGELIRDDKGSYHRIQVTGGDVLYAKPRILRKIPPKQDWVRLCNLSHMPECIT
jgi:hypothetical protein